MKQFSASVSDFNFRKRNAVCKVWRVIAWGFMEKITHFIQKIAIFLHEIAF